MAIEERIRFFRKMRGMTQKYLGMLMGFPERSADVRMAQYETGSRTPKADLTRALAAAFEVSPSALTIPDIDTDIGLMHTLFALEDLRGLTIRVQESAFMSRMVELLGATPVQIPYNDVYSALRTGKIDGAENNWPSYAFTGHYQAARYCLQDEHSRLPEMQIMSTVALDKIAGIDEDYVTIIRQCARECALYERELWRAQDADSERLVREHGCVVTQLTSAQREAFRRAVEPMYQEYPPEEQALIRRIRES